MQAQSSKSFCEQGLQRVRDAESHLKRAQSERILAWYAAERQGATRAEIAHAAGLSPSTVSKRMGAR